MGVLISIEPGTAIALVACAGILRRDDLEEAARALWKVPGWRGKAVVWDFRESHLELSTDDLRQIAQFTMHNQLDPPPARIAAVAPSDLEYGLARMFEAFRDDPRSEFHVFREYDKALAWARATHQDAPDEQP